MAGRRSRWVGPALGAAVAAVVVGFGTHAFGPARAAASDQAQAAPATGATGESATSRPAPSTTGRPTRTATPARTTPGGAVPPGRKPAGGCPQGADQRAVETALAQLGHYGAVTVDGRQSAGDCAAIKSFQLRYGIWPAEGRAGPTTADVARRLAVSRTDDEHARCRTAGTPLTICVDLTQQTVWAVRDGAIVWGPTIVRTGMKGGYQTPTGRYEIFGRAAKEWSKPYKVWLPYWQAFNGGIGFHEATTYLHDGSRGSHGCVNLLHDDAVALWNLAGVGTGVRVFGSRPGT